VAQLLQLGADCFALWRLSAGPAASSWEEHPRSLLSIFQSSDVCEVFLAHLERQRVAGSLQLHGKQQAAELLGAAALCGHAPLIAHSIIALEGQLSAEIAGEQPLTAEDAEELSSILFAAAGASSGAEGDSLRALLASRLPFDLAARDSGLCLLARAATSGVPAATVPLLHAAGAPLDLEALLHAAQEFAADGVAALLACGRPPVDASTAACMYVSHDLSYSCPIHRILHRLVSVCAGCWLVSHAFGLPCRALPLLLLLPIDACTGCRWLVSPTSAMPCRALPLLRLLLMGCPNFHFLSRALQANDPAATPERQAAALRTLEALLAAGYRPTVWHGVAPPPFLLDSLPPGTAVLQRLDPFDFYPAGQPSER
jgi:hypothetical protein